MRQAEPLRVTQAGTGVITFARTPILGGMTLLRGEAFTGHYRPHLHTTYVIGVVEQGRLGLSTGGVTHLLGPGSVLLLDPFQVHEEFSVGPAGWSFRYFFPSSAELSPHAPRFGSPVVRDKRIADNLIRLHQSLVAAGESPAESSGPQFVDALRRLARLSRADGLPAQPSSPVLRALEFLHAASSSAVRLSSLARIAEMSPFQLVRLFGSEVGLPPHAYYEQLRVARCKELLHGSQVPGRRPAAPEVGLTASG